MAENEQSTSEVLVLHLEPVQFWINGFISSMGIMVYQMHGFLANRENGWLIMNKAKNKNLIEWS